MLGIESFDDNKLSTMHKAHTTSDSEKVIRLLKSHGMIIYGFGMAKPEWDTKENITGQFKKLKQLGITYADMTIETHVLGTQYWENNKSRIIALKNGKPDWEQWDYLTPVIPVKHMSAREFQATVKHAMRWFYSIKRGVKAIIKGKVSQGLTILYVWYIAGKMYTGVPDAKRDNLH